MVEWYASTFLSFLVKAKSTHFSLALSHKSVPRMTHQIDGRKWKEEGRKELQMRLGNRCVMGGWWWDRWGRSVREWKLIKWRDRGEERRFEASGRGESAVAKSKNHKTQAESVAISETRKNGKFLDPTELKFETVEITKKFKVARLVGWLIGIGWQIIFQVSSSSALTDSWAWHFTPRRGAFWSSPSDREHFLSTSYLDISSSKCFSALCVKKNEAKSTFQSCPRRKMSGPLFFQHEWRIPFHVKTCDSLPSPSLMHNIIRSAYGGRRRKNVVNFFSTWSADVSAALNYFRAPPHFGCV